LKPTTEDIIERSAIEILQSQGWGFTKGKEISTEGLFCERDSFQQIILTQRLRKAIARINQEIPGDAREQDVLKGLSLVLTTKTRRHKELKINKKFFCVFVPQW